MQSVVIPNWMPDIPDHRSGRIVPQHRQVLFVGRLVHNKGLQDILDAIRELHSSIALIVTGKGPERKNYERLAIGLPVRFSGYVPDLAKLYRQVDALIVPSHGPEGSCLVALEAMANGLPCIMSDLAVYREIAQDGAAALLFPVGDSHALAASIQRLTNDPDLGTELAANAYRMVKSQYSVEAISEAYLRVFDLAPATQEMRQGARS